jgi:hypothetical protein
MPMCNLGPFYFSRIHGVPAFPASRTTTLDAHSGAPNFGVDAGLRRSGRTHGDGSAAVHILTASALFSKNLYRPLCARHDRRSVAKLANRSRLAQFDQFDSRDL